MICFVTLEEKPKPESYEYGSRGPAKLDEFITKSEFILVTGSQSVTLRRGRLTGEYQMTVWNVRCRLRAFYTRLQASW